MHDSYLSDLKQYSPKLLELDQIPLTYVLKDFPWSSFSSELAEKFECESFNISLQKSEWAEKEPLLDGFDQVDTFQFFIPAVESTVELIMNKNSMQNLHSLLLGNEINQSIFNDKSFAESFHAFIFLELIKTFNLVSPNIQLEPVFNRAKELKKAHAYFILTLLISCHSQQFIAKLILSKETLIKLTQNYKELKLRDLCQNSDLMIPASIEVGYVCLTPKELSELNCGDVIILDKCSYDFDSKSGDALLRLSSRNVVSVTISDDKVQVKECTLFEE